MPISKLRRQPDAAGAQPTTSTGEWKWFSFFGDSLRFNSDSGQTRYVLTSDAEVVTAANTLTASETGKTFFLNSATEFDTVLPAVALGLRFTFIVKAAPSGASYTITAAAGDTIIGKVHSAAGDAGDVENTAGADVINFVDGQAVAGDRVDLVCDGTYWYAVAFSSVAAGITFTG